MHQFEGSCKESQFPILLSLLRRIRVIVVDDCSTDQTPAVLRRFQEWLDVSFGGGKFEWQILRHKHNFISST